MRSTPPRMKNVGHQRPTAGDEPRRQRRDPRRRHRPDDRHAAHQLLPERPEGRQDHLQIRHQQSVAGAGTASVPRDLRVLAPLRRPAPARRSRRARRPALVGPHGRLPHRSARPRQGADGEERRRRAGRRQGRLRLQADAEDAIRETIAAEGEAVYRLFISSLLEVTDNRVLGKIVAPTDTVCYDGADPYLVVAADKGTATFSDIANSIAVQRGFWLGDAFASGGSNGYDHKKLGITAKGAFEAVKRHFYELDHDMNTTPITMVGVGDMSGDVFGNGALLSRQLKVIAAFDHRHIFLDPTPDVVTSFAERERMFALPRSSWDDYNKELISAGGGVYPRSARTIELSPQSAP